jgi:hypothetical protein
VNHREINPTERMVDAFDRANTMTFAVVAEVRGALSHTAIEAALRKLEKRHPSLRACVERDGDEITLTHGEGVAIPLVVETGNSERLQALAAKSIEHQLWSDVGPRAELTWLRMDDGRSALVLRFHHLVSDGSSGMFAMRDLLSFLAAPDEPVDPIDSPGLHAFLPTSHGGLADLGRTFWMEARAFVAAKPQRLRAAECPPSQRVAQLSTIQLSDVDSARLIARARRDGTTAHGVLCAALSLAVAAEIGGTTQQRLMHPVDLRRYLRGRYPNMRPIGDCAGYYVSSVDTDHRVDATIPLPKLAADITEAIRHGKANGEPLLTAPVAGAWVVRATRRMTPERFCKLAERELMLATHSITNLGPLETLGLRRDFGALSLDNIYFVAAGSVLSTLGGSASSFDGRLRLNLTAAAPVVERAAFERIVQRVGDKLAEYVLQN